MSVKTITNEDGSTTTTVVNADGSQTVTTKAVDGTETVETIAAPSDDIETVITERLKPIKEKLDRAFAERDELARKLAEKEQKDREAEIQRLKDAGRESEALNMQLASEKAAREAAERRNIELTRDIDLKDALVGLPFKNDKALKLAQSEITAELVQDEQGIWKHKSGVSIKDYAKLFADNPANEFLFKAKVNNGAGDVTTTSTSTTTTPKSIFEMTQEEVLKQAAAGKLPRRKR